MMLQVFHKTPYSRHWFYEYGTHIWAQNRNKKHQLGSQVILLSWTIGVKWMERISLLNQIWILWKLGSSLLGGLYKACNVIFIFQESQVAFKTLECGYKLFLWDRPLMENLSFCSSPVVKASRFYSNTRDHMIRWYFTICFGKKKQ